MRVVRPACLATQMRSTGAYLPRRCALGGAVTCDVPVGTLVEHFDAENYAIRAGTVPTLPRVGTKLRLYEPCPDKDERSLPSESPLHSTVCRIAQPEP